MNFCTAKKIMDTRTNFELLLCLTKLSNMVLVRNFGIRLVQVLNQSVYNPVVLCNIILYLCKLFNLLNTARKAGGTVLSITFCSKGLRPASR
jgi:hypothetical protein